MASYNFDRPSEVVFSKTSAGTFSITVKGTLVLTLEANRYALLSVAENWNGSTLVNYSLIVEAGHDIADDDKTIPFTRDGAAFVMVLCKNSSNNFYVIGEDDIRDAIIGDEDHCFLLSIYRSSTRHSVIVKLISETVGQTNKYTLLMYNDLVKRGVASLRRDDGPINELYSYRPAAPDNQKCV